MDCRRASRRRARRRAFASAARRDSGASGPVSPCKRHDDPGGVGDLALVDRRPPEGGEELPRAVRLLLLDDLLRDQLQALFLPLRQFGQRPRGDGQERQPHVQAPTLRPRVGRIGRVGEDLRGQQLLPAAQQGLDRIRHESSCRSRTPAVRLRPAPRAASARDGRRRIPARFSQAALSVCRYPMARSTVCRTWGVVARGTEVGSPARAGRERQSTRRAPTKRDARAIVSISIKPEGSAANRSLLGVYSITDRPAIAGVTGTFRSAASRIIDRQGDDADYLNMKCALDQSGGLVPPRALFPLFLSGPDYAPVGWRPLPQLRQEPASIRSDFAPNRFRVQLVRTLYGSFRRVGVRLTGSLLS